MPDKKRLETVKGPTELRPSMVSKVPPLPEEMKAMLQADRIAREHRAAERIKAVLAEERCVMNPTMSLTVRGIIPGIEVTAQD